MRQDILTKKDAELFYKLKHSLYLYANRKIKVLPDSNDWKSIYKCPLEKIAKVRDYVFIKNKAIIDEFADNNPFSFTKEELDLVLAWKKAIIADKWIIWKYEREHALFIHDNKVYGIKGIIDSFEDVFQAYSPVFIDLIVLPFKDCLTHEGLFSPYQISFGKNMKNSIMAEAEEIVLKRGIITSLTQNSTEKNPSETELLKFYMKSEVNRNRFYEQISALKRKLPELLAVYNYETGRINAKNIKSELIKLGIKGHFGVLSSQVIASGKTKQELEANITKIILPEKRNQVYSFSIT